MERTAPSALSSKAIPLGFILLVAVVVHAPLLLMKLPLKSYDTNQQLFFAYHYLHDWWNPWNVKWFTGFSQTTYPPLPQQWTAILAHIVGLQYAYMLVQFVAILLLAVGMYRFAAIWVNERAASFASLAVVLLGSESFLIYNAGQLATTWEAALYVLALPYLYEWLRYGGWRPFVKAVVLFAATCSAHDVIIIFGTAFFTFPLIALAIMEREQGEEKTTGGAVVARAVAVAIIAAAAIAIVLLPYWIDLFRYPVTQTPIPHASRANYLLTPFWGTNYFLIPWGALMLALPFIVWRGAHVRRLVPLMLGFWACFLVGLGGTTPVALWLLHRAFYVLTFERVAYWAELLSLPILGLLCSELVARFRMKAVVPLVVLAAITCGLPIAWANYQPTNSINLDVGPVAEWLNRGGHDNYRYFTLGFGNNISRLSIETNANTVDGEWYSDRRLPELMKYGGGSLDNSKYFVPGGLDALRAILHHADRYGLKWVFVHDPWYDPLLHFAGWRQVDQLEYGAIQVWSKEAVPPAHPMVFGVKPPAWQGIMWGILPVGSSILAFLLVFIPDKRRQIGASEDVGATDETIVPERMAS